MFSLFFSHSRSYDEFSQGSGASYEDSYERELREYAGSQRYGEGVGGVATTNAVTANNRRHSFSPARRRDDPSPGSQRAHSRDRNSLSPSPRVSYEDGESVSRRTARRSTSDHDSFHSQSPPGSRAASPPPPPRPSKGSSTVTSRLAPPRSPGTPIAASPSREVTLLEDRSLPDPRDYRRRTSDLKDLVVRVSDGRRPTPAAPPESPHRSNAHRLHRSSHTEDGEDVVSSSSGGASGPQDPRLVHRRLTEDPPSSGDERPSDQERPHKKPRYNDANYEKVVSVKRLADSSDSITNFRRPHDTRRDGRLIRRSGDSLPHPTRQSEEVHDPRYRRSSVSDADDTHWRRDAIHVSSSCDAAADHSDASPPGTPVRDERDDSSDPLRHAPHHHHHHHHHNHHHHHHRDRYHSVPLSLPLPRFAQQVRAHLSPRAASTSPKGASLLRSPPFSGGVVAGVRGDSRELGSAVVDTPLSPGPRDTPSDSEESPLPSPCSPSIDLEQRIRALDEKYEKWSGSSRVVGNNLPPPPNDTGSDNGSSAAVGGNKNARFARILDLEELRSQPSDIVKSLLSKRSVFDEDSKRLENVGDKYEPKPFTSAPRTSRAGSVMPSPPMVSTHLPRLPSTPPAVPSATPISSLPGVRLSSQQAQLQQPVTSSPSQVPRVFVSVPQVSKSQGLSPLHRPAVSQAVRPPASSPGFSPGVSPGVSPAHPPHMSPVTPVSPAPPITTTSSITTATNTTSAVTPLRRASATPRAVRLDLPGGAGDVGEVLEEESPGGVVTVVADTRVTGVVSVTESVSSSKSVLTTTSSLQQPLSSPGARPDLEESAPHNVPERRGVNSLPLLVKEEPHTEEAEDPVLQRVKVEQPKLEDAKTKDCVREVNECREVVIAVVASETIPSLVKEEPVASETIKHEPLKVESYKPESIKVEPMKVENIKVEPVKCETNNKEITNNHKRRHSSIENDPRYKVDVKSFEPDSKRVKYDDEEKILREKVVKERRDSRDTRDNKKSEREKKNSRGRREEVQENHTDKINNRTCDTIENKQKRKPCESKIEDKKEDTHKKEEKKDKRKEKIEEKPHDKIDTRTLDKICERKNEDRKDSRKEEKKEDKKEERREEKREEKYEDRREERREEKKEERKDSIREDRKDPVREERKDSIREERKDSIREEKKESLRDERKESIREERKDSIREERKDSLREERKESMREERVKSEGEKRRHSEDKKSELREQKHKERKDKFKEKDKIKTSSTSRYEKEAEKERMREKEREREKEKEREREKEEEKEKEREKMLEKEREKEREKLIEKEKAAEKEREKMLEREREREKAMEREREKAIEREKMAEREREKALEKEREKAFERERERERAAEKEREKAMEKDKKKSSEKEREKLEKDKLYEKDRDKLQEKERDRDRDREKDKMRSNERPRDRDKERLPRLNHRDAAERTDGRRDSRHNSDRHNDKRRDSRHEASVRHHHRSYDNQDTNDTISKHKIRKTRLLDTDEEDVPEVSKVSSIHYSSSEDTVMPNHDACTNRLDDSTHRQDKTAEAMREESEERRVERARDNRRRKHDSGKSDKSDGEAKSKGSSSRVKTTPPQPARTKPCLDSHEPQVAPSDVPTSEDEVSRAKVTPASRRNSTSNKSHQLHARIGVSGQKNKHVNKTKSIFDPETDSCGSLTGSGGEEDGEEEQAPKKHSIFDIPADDGKFDMYDKVKARRLKRQQKQEEERRQQEIKQLQMQKYRQHQRARKEKKSIQPLHSDISDSEEDVDGTNRCQKRGLIRPTSSDEDTLRKRRSAQLTSDETDEDLCSRDDKKQSSLPGYKKDPKIKLRNILVSDITTDEEVTMNSPNYHSGIKSNCIHDGDSVDMVHSHPDNIFVDSDTESDAHIKRPNKCVRQPESDSEVSDVCSHTKPPKPAARVKVRDKERKPGRMREKPKKTFNISKEIITTSEDSDTAMPSEDSRPVRPKVKAEAVEIRHDKTLSHLQRERKRTGEGTITRDKVPSKKDERMEIIFGHISDDSDPSPTLPDVCPVSATAKRKGSTSSGTSTAPPPLSPAQTRLTVGEVYDSDSDDIHMMPASSASKYSHMRAKPTPQEPPPSVENKVENKVDTKITDFKTEERRSIKKERPHFDPPPPPPDGMRTVLEVEKSCSSHSITNNAVSPGIASINSSPAEESSRTDIKMPLTKEEHDYQDSEASINMDLFRITNEDYSEQRDSRKDRKKKKRQKRDKDGSRGRKHHRRMEEDRAAEHKMDHHGIEHSSLLCMDAASPQSQDMASPRLLSPQEKVKVDHRAPVPLSSPHSPPVAGEPAVSLSTNTQCAPSSPPEPPPHQTPHTHTLTRDTQELVESRENSDPCDPKGSHSPHPLATLPPDAAESAVQSLTTQVPTSSPSTGNEPIFEDITEASNLSAPESTVDANAAANGKASRAVISQEETLNAVAGLLACYDDYSDDASVQPNVEDTIMPPDNQSVADDAFEEAQKAAQMLQCEMPGEREDGWPQPPPHNPPSSPVKPPEEPEPQPLVPQEDIEGRQTPEAEEGRYSQLPPDSPGSVQSEPPLQIDEDQPDPADDGDSSMLTAEDQEDSNNTREADNEPRSRWSPPPKPAAVTARELNKDRVHEGSDKKSIPAPKDTKDEKVPHTPVIPPQKSTENSSVHAALKEKTQPKNSVPEVPVSSPSQSQPQPQPQPQSCAKLNAETALPPAVVPPSKKPFTLSSTKNLSSSLDSTKCKETPKSTIIPVTSTVTSLQSLPVVEKKPDVVSCKPKEPPPPPVTVASPCHKMESFVSENSVVYSTSSHTNSLVSTSSTTLTTTSSLSSACSRVVDNVSKGKLDNNQINRTDTVSRADPILPLTIPSHIPPRVSSVFSKNSINTSLSASPKTLSPSLYSSVSSASPCVTTTSSKSSITPVSESSPMAVVKANQTPIPTPFSASTSTSVSAHDTVVTSTMTSTVATVASVQTASSTHPPAVHPPTVHPPAVHPPAVHPPAVQPPAVQSPTVQPPAVQSPPLVKVPSTSTSSSVTCNTTFPSSPISIATSVLTHTSSVNSPPIPTVSSPSTASPTTPDTISVTKPPPPMPTPTFIPVPITGPVPPSVPVPAKEPKTATEPSEIIDTKLILSKASDDIKREPDKILEPFSSDPLPKSTPSTIADKVIDSKSNLETQMTMNMTGKADNVIIQPKEIEGTPSVSGRPTSDAIKIEGPSSNMSVENALANLQTIVSETATQPDLEKASQPEREEASLCMKEEFGPEDLPPKPSSPPQPQDDFAKLEQVCSEIQNQNQDSTTENKSTEPEGISEIGEKGIKLEDRSATTPRARGRGRGRRGGRKVAETQEDLPGGVLPVTRSGAATRGKGRGRGRNTRNSESQKDGSQADPGTPIPVDKALPEPRRSNRTKRARRHPDMVDHEETSGRRRRGRGGRAVQAEESRPMPTPAASDVYDFHESEDEDINLGLAKPKIKKEPARAVVNRSPVKPEVEEVRRVESDDLRPSTAITRRSGRLRDKVPEDDQLVGEGEDGNTSESIVILDSVSTAQPSPGATSVPVPLPTSFAPTTQVIPGRGRGKGKHRDIDIKCDGDLDDDPASRRSPRGRSRPLDSQVEGEKPGFVPHPHSHPHPHPHPHVTLPTISSAAPSITTVGTTTTPSGTTLVTPTLEERKSEAELVDPVTGVVTRVKVCEEGQYVTDTGEAAIPPTSHSLTKTESHNKQIIVPTSVNSNNNVTTNSSASVESPHINTMGSWCRPGVTMTVVSSNAVTPLTSVGRDREVSVELVTRPPRPSLPISTQSSGTVPTLVPTMSVTASPSVSHVMPSAHPPPPGHSSLSGVVALGAAPRPSPNTSVYLSKMKPGQPPLPQSQPQMQPQSISQQQQSLQRLQQKQQMTVSASQSQPQVKVSHFHLSLDMFLVSQSQLN